MFSALLLVTGAAGAAYALLALPEWLRTRATILLFAVLPLAGAALGALLAGAGHFVADPASLRGLAGLPVIIGLLAVPLALFSFATLCRRFDFAWARPDWGHGSVCLAAVALLLYDFTLLGPALHLARACWADVTWHGAGVPAALACGGDPVPGAPPGLVLALAAGAVASFGLGLGLWRNEGWAPAALLAGAGCLLLLVPAAFGPVPRLAGEVLVFAALVAATLRHVRTLPTAERTAD